MKHLIDSTNTVTLQAENFQDRAWLSSFFKRWHEAKLHAFIQARRECDAGYTTIWDDSRDLNDIVAIRFIAPYGEM